jgi:hypothetical protein
MIQKEIELANDTYQMIDKQYRNNLTSIKEVLDALNDLEKQILNYKNPITINEELLQIFFMLKEPLITNNLIKV